MGMNGVALLAVIVIAISAFSPKNTFIFPKAPFALTAPKAAASSAPVSPLQGGGKVAPVNTPKGNSPVAGPAVSPDLLPKKPNRGVMDFDPARLLQGQSFIHGVPGSVAGSLRNANLQIRSDPPIKRVPVSIFNQSTIAQDTFYPQIEIGRTNFYSTHQK